MDVFVIDIHENGFEVLSRNLQALSNKFGARSNDPGSQLMLRSV